MYIADYHTHSSCSLDGSRTMLEMARAAVDAGLDEICFTDHVDTIVWNTNERRTDHDWSKAISQYREAQSALGERITIRLGAEFGENTIYPDISERNLRSAPPLDFIIGSVHTAAKKDDWLDFCHIRKADAAYWNALIEGYLQEVDALTRWPFFDVLGHLTLPLRYANETLGLGLTFDAFSDRTDAIFRRLIDSGRGIECNTNRGSEPLPGADLLRRYRELGGEIITLGSDAHTADRVGCCIRERQELLRECGFRYICTFREHTPIFHKL